MREPNLLPVLSDIAHFSRFIINLPLYDYQLQPVRAVLDSVLGRHGREFLLIFPRQSGKNEAVAQLLVYLMNLLQRKGGAVVYGAIGDGLGRGLRRLEQRLDNPLNHGRWRKTTSPTARWLGRARPLWLAAGGRGAVGRLSFTLARRYTNGIGFNGFAESF